MALRFRPLILAAFVLVVAGAAALAQSIWFQGEGYRDTGARVASRESFDGTFHFCRLQYRSAWREAGGSGWSTDYPGADINFSIRLSELTKTRVRMNPRTQDPDHLVVPIGSDMFFQCPFLSLEDAGTAFFNPLEADTLRDYLLKGGFIWADDFWGSRAWERWADQIAKVLRPEVYPIVDIPITHAMFHTLFDVKRVPQVPSIQSWRRSRGSTTSERGADSAEVHVRGIFNERGRLMVLMTHNTDISDTWEREGEDPEYFYRFSPEGYAVAIDVMLYTMSH
jgi:hypothetical protein